MTEEIMSAVNDRVCRLVPDWCCVGILDAGRIRYGRSRFYQSQKLRQYFDEEPDGLLYWMRCIYPDRFQPTVG